MASDPNPHTASQRRPRAVCGAVAALLVLGASACSSGDDDKQVAGPAQYVESTTTAPTRGTSSTVADTGGAVDAPTETTQPLSVDDLAEAEAHNHDHIDNEFDDLEGFETPDTPPSADPGDPKAVALNWGCAYRAKPAGEGTDAWVARVAPLMTERAVAKMTAMSSPPQPNSEVVRPLGAVEIEPATAERGPKYRVNCDVKIVDAAGDVIADGAVAPVLVILAQTDAGWLVDDFSYGGIRFDG